MVAPVEIDQLSVGLPLPADVNGSPELSFSPGLVDPTNPAFATSRKPLAGEFKFGGNTVFVVGNHFNSKVRAVGYQTPYAWQHVGLWL
jgi:predicted extracellular nuclease